MPNNNYDSGNVCARVYVCMWILLTNSRLHITFVSRVSSWLVSKIADAEF